MSQRDPRRRTYRVIVHSVCVPVLEPSVSVVERRGDVFCAVQLPAGELLCILYEWWNNKCECEYRWVASDVVITVRRGRRGERVHTDKAETAHTGAFNSFCLALSIFLQPFVVSPVVPGLLYRVNIHFVCQRESPIIKNVGNIWRIHRPYLHVVTAWIVAFGPLCGPGSGLTSS